MSGRILIVDSVCTNRIGWRAALQSAHYAVVHCASVAEARAEIATARPDLVVVDTAADDGAALALIADLRRDPETRALPVIATGSFAGDAARLAALRAGADDVQAKPLHLPLLLARIRSLLRARHAETELDPRDGTQAVLGFADEAEPFAGPVRVLGRTAVLTAPDTAPLPVLAALAADLPGPCTVKDAARDPDDGGSNAPADLFVIDATAGCETGLGTLPLFRLVADLRSRPATRHAAILAVLPTDCPDMAVMALDLGVDDLVTDAIGVAELAFRAKQLLAAKARVDRLRDNVRTGLQAAVIDPLTGLHNRRFALPQLDRMVARAQREGSPVALMILDIDHFKAINDRHGHAIGDTVLAEVARRLRQHLRPADLIARIGGEEFLIAMPDTPGDVAHFAAERLRRAIEGRAFVTGREGQARPRHRGELRVTLSIGVAIGPDAAVAGDAAGSALFDRADAALYAAKSAGRNKVTLSHTAA